MLKANPDRICLNAHLVSTNFEIGLRDRGNSCCSISRPEPSDRRGGSLSFLPFHFQEPDPLVDVGINRMIRLGKITRRKQGSANMLHVVVADGVGKNR
jgi:hypothetical protein